MINVVAAIIKNKEGKILIAQRNLKKAQGGLWEFPGGKVEYGETQEAAIVREIKEELNMDIKFDECFDEKIYKYPEKTIRLIAINCSMIGDTYEVREHEQIVWVTPDEFFNYKFAPADIYFVNKIVNNK
ncbi:MAG: (deoxy)nucleoside triphosphate pyrophosphohydrolase [Tenericutes bacterium]|nr:(deoxy)nucleoside triphosphate pyrophosphohydrolase [Mycoplasmatota bacterium]